MINYVVIDAGKYSTRRPSRAGTQWTKTTRVDDYTGRGAAISASGASVIIRRIPGASKHSADRRVWARVRGALGSRIEGRSVATGAVGAGILTSDDAWHWVEFPVRHKRRDASYELHGVTDGVIVDSLILVDVNNRSVPNGKYGFP